MTDPGHRNRCYRCHRPTAMCYCEGLPQVDTATRIVILQHPHERTHPFGTARLARLCMPNTSVHVPCPGYTGTLAMPVEVPEDAAVLFPHPDADDLAQMPREQWPSTLIAIDGTWAHAKRLYRENTWLHHKRHVRLQPSSPSNYRIRKEPRPDYISTLEAIVEAVRIIEPDANGLDDLLAAFDRMIDRQIAHTSTVGRVVRRKSTREREARAISPLLADDRLVILYAEASLPGGDQNARRELVHWVAARIDGDDTFEAFLRPPTELPTAFHMQHMGLDAEVLRSGETLADAARRFALWLGEGVPVAVWTESSLTWGEAMLPATSEHTQLKISYCNTRQRSAGYLDHAVAREGLTPVANRCRGRAGERLSFAVAIARWLRDRKRLAPDATIAT